MDFPDPKNFTRLLRYAVSGGIALGVDLLLLYLFTDIFGWWYLAASILAFSFAIIVSFFLQKYWTFQDRATDRAPVQFILYIAIAIANTALNTGFMYLFVRLLDLHYLFAQLLAAGIIALESFYLYRTFIFGFRDNKEEGAFS